LVRIERDRFDAERDARLEADERERRAQAESVYYQLEVTEGRDATRNVEIRNESDASVVDVELRALTCEPSTIKPPELFGTDEVVAAVEPWSKKWEAVPPSHVRRTLVLVDFHGNPHGLAIDGPRLSWHPNQFPFVPDFWERLDLRGYRPSWGRKHPDVSAEQEPRAFYEHVVSELRPFSKEPIITGFVLAFTDIHGTRWVLDENGNLAEFSEPVDAG
jgi:hypothetical protein